MSNRDYANKRPQSGAKPRSMRAAPARSAQKKAAPRKKLPLALILFAFIAVGCFGYFLWSIKDMSKQVSPATTAEKTEPSAKVQDPVATLTPKVKETDRQADAVAPKKDPNDLPPQPQEEWTYLNELENKHVEVDIPDVVASRAPQQYQLQCASFRQESQANQMKAVIAFQGLEAQIRQIEGSTGTWYKVGLGPYQTKRDAERKRHVLQNAGINGCQILAIAK